MLPHPVLAIILSYIDDGPTVAHMLNFVDADRITELDCIDFDFKLVAALKNLRSLRLVRPLGASLGLLTGLTSLTRIDMRGFPCMDLSVLAGLPLRYLRFEMFHSKDISFVSSLAQLEYLELPNFKGVDISPLAAIASLTHLDLNSFRGVDISPLRGLTSLTYLDLDEFEGDDLTPLTGLRGLTYLNLGSSCGTGDLSPIARLTSLTELNLPAVRGCSLTPLASLTRLTHLDLTSSASRSPTPVPRFGGFPGRPDSHPAQKYLGSQCCNCLRCI